LGGLHTDLSGRVLGPDGKPLPGLYAAGEVAGFGGGGMHGYRSLEGTFLGGCLFSGRTAGRAAAESVASCPRRRWGGGLTSVTSYDLPTRPGLASLASRRVVATRSSLRMVSWYSTPDWANETRRR